MPKRSRSARSRIANLGEYIPKTKKPRRLKVDHDKENVCDASSTAAIAQARMAKTFFEISQPVGSELALESGGHLADKTVNVAVPDCDLFENDHHDHDGDSAESRSASGSDGRNDERGNLCVSVGDGNGGDAFVPAPETLVARAALVDVTEILSPTRKSGLGHDPFEGDELLRKRLQMVKMLLWNYTNGVQPLAWMAASLQTAHSFQAGTHTAKRMRKWARAFMNDRTDLPINLYGSWNVSLLDKGELAKDIHLHLQEKGKWVKALDIVHFLDTPEIKERYSLKRTISLATAQRWMHMMNYRWTKMPSGQYVDGHEREDVVTYRQSKFLPTIAELEWNLRVWKDGIEEAMSGGPLNRRIAVLWFHDESTFYANDRRTVRWVHEDEKAVPRAKGEGASLMVADFVSADHGWLRSAMGDDAARTLFKAGKARDGYFTNDDILKHASVAMDILDKHFPDERHIFVFDNATTHLKRADDALSARKMSKAQTKPNSPFFGVLRNVINPDGKPVYTPDGKLKKEKVCMADGRFANGLTQSLYFPPDHPRAGVFKGMAIILEERGYKDVQNIRAECPKFQCEKGVDRCCCRRMLYNEPDFVEVESLLETLCKSRGYCVTFLPKFHCELNFIEQCWGYAKRKYRLNPPSSSEANLERNVIAALDSVPIQSMRRDVPGLASSQEPGQARPI